MSTIIGNPIMLGGGGGISAPIIGKDFNWTGSDGTYQVRDDGNKNWRIKFLSSGTFTPLKNMIIDVFLVGGGGGGAGSGSGKSDWPILNGASGGGGYTTTVKSVTLTKNVEYTITIGEGGAPYYSSTNVQSKGTDGGATSAFGSTVEGGKAGDNSVGGGNGGSGGSYGGAAPGSDGADGGTTSTHYAGGTGQGTTTREFGEPSGDLYSGGGASNSGRETTGTGADGGGGDVNDNGTPNTGGGGGSPAGKSGVGYGGSGIVIIRKHKEAAA